MCSVYPEPYKLHHSKMFGLVRVRKHLQFSVFSCPWCISSRLLLLPCRLHAAHWCKRSCHRSTAVTGNTVSHNGFQNCGTKICEIKFWRKRIVELLSADSATCNFTCLRIERLKYNVISCLPHLIFSVDTCRPPSSFMCPPGIIGQEARWRT